MKQPKTYYVIIAAYFSVLAIISSFISHMVDIEIWKGLIASLLFGCITGDMAHNIALFILKLLGKDED